MLEVVLIILMAVVFMGIVAVTMWTWWETFAERDGLALIVALLLTLILLIPVAIIVDNQKENNATQEVQTVQVEIMDKVYHPATTRVIIINKMTTIVPVAAKYLVTVKTGEFTHVFDNEQFFKEFELRDKFDMRLTNYIGKDGKLFEQKLNFIQ